MEQVQHYDDEDLDINYRKQLANNEIEFVSDYIYVDPKIITYEIPPGILKLNVIKNAFEGNVELQSEGKTERAI